MFPVVSFIKRIAALSLVLLLTLFAYPAFAGQASLAWNASASTDIAGYKVHYSTASGSYATHVDVGNSLSAIVPNLTAGGTYYFAVTAYNSAGESAYSNEASATIPVAVAAPVAAFTGSPLTGTAPLNSTFTSTSTGTNSSTTYAWNFGDGTSATGASASKTYSTAGTYMVTLVATNNPGGSSPAATKTVTVTAPAVAPVASFTGSPLTGTAPLNSTFTSTSTGTNSSTTYAWNFGDGTSATGASASKTYGTPGTYTVTLVATNNPGGSSTPTTRTVTVTAPAAAPVASFNASATTGTAPLSSTFTSTSTGTNSSTTYAWTFSDGTSATGASVSKTYSTPGTYTVTLVATNNPGGSSPAATQTVTVTAPVTDPLAADFSANRTAGAVPLRVAFAEASSGTVETYLWNFGDGSTSSEAQPVHTFRMPGSFTVSLTIAGPAGTKTMTKSAYVKAVAANDLVADFGPGSGIWSFRNGSTWNRTDSRSARQIVMTDVDHNGASDVLVDLGTDALGTSLGIWRLSKDGVWTAVDSRTAKNMVTGDFDGNGQDDQVIDFGTGKGLWLLANGADWSQIDTRTARNLLLADLDHDGRDELIADFGAGAGIWSYTASAGWAQIDSRSASWMMAADLDGNDQSDLVADFGPGTGTWGSPNGVWARMNGSTWLQIDPRTASRGTAVNPDGNRKEELALHYSGDGIYLYSHTTPVGTNLTNYVASNWLKISSQAPTRMVAADLNSDGKQDLVVDFGAGNSNGLWKYSSGSWTKINKKTTTGIVSGQFR